MSILQRTRTSEQKKHMVRFCVSPLPAVSGTSNTQQLESLPPLSTPVDRLQTYHKHCSQTTTMVNSTTHVQPCTSNWLRTGNSVTISDACQPVPLVQHPVVRQHNFIEPLIKHKFDTYTHNIPLEHSIIPQGHPVTAQGYFEGHNPSRSVAYGSTVYNRSYPSTYSAACANRALAPVHPSQLPVSSIYTQRPLIAETICSPTTTYIPASDPRPNPIAMLPQQTQVESKTNLVPPPLLPLESDDHIDQSPSQSDVDQGCSPLTPPSSIPSPGLQHSNGSDDSTSYTQVCNNDSDNGHENKMVPDSSMQSYDTSNTSEMQSKTSPESHRPRKHRLSNDCYEAVIEKKSKTDTGWDPHEDSMQRICMKLRWLDENDYLNNADLGLLQITKGW